LTNPCEAEEIRATLHKRDDTARPLYDRPKAVFAIVGAPQMSGGIRIAAPHAPVRQREKAIHLARLPRARQMISDELV
jgi:hypothetical protein